MVMLIRLTMNMSVAMGTRAIRVRTVIAWTCWVRIEGRSLRVMR